MSLPNPADTVVTTDVNAAIRDYFLWRASGAGAAVPNQESSTAASSSNNRLHAESNAERIKDGKMPAQTGPNGENFDGTSNGESNNSTVAANDKYQQLADLMKQLFPNLGDPQVVGVPHVFSRYTLFTPLYQRVVSLKEQKEALETQVTQLQQNQALQVSQKQATAVARGKRKDPPAAAASPLAALTAQTSCPPAAETPGNKRPRTTDNKSRNIVGRKDVPADVQELITSIRRDLSQQKRKTKRVTERLEKEKAKAAEKAREEALKALAKADKAQAKRAKAPKAEKAQADPLCFKTEPNKTWDERIQELEHFAKGNGHCRVKTRARGGLGPWVVKVRKTYKDLQSMSQEERSLQFEFQTLGAYDLNPERIQQLNDMGFEWCLSNAPIPWETRHQQLVDYKEKHGHLIVPRSDPDLGEYVHKVRQDYKRKAPVIMGERAEKLEALGFVWDVTGGNPTFEDRLEECRDFRRQHGHLSVPRKAEMEEFNQLSHKERSFRSWAYRTRGEYRDFCAGLKSRIDKTRIRQLEELGFDFSIDNVRKGRYNQGKSETQSDK